jgi:hypothetical protein
LKRAVGSKNTNKKSSPSSAETVLPSSATVEKSVAIQNLKQIGLGAFGVTIKNTTTKETFRAHDTPAKSTGLFCRAFGKEGCKQNKTRKPFGSSQGKDEHENHCLPAQAVKAAQLDEF